MIEKLREQNPHIPIFEVHSVEFDLYGKVIRGYNLSSYINYVLRNAVLGDGVTYDRSIRELERLPLTKKMQNELFGGIPIQIGWCVGHNNKLNALEYHKSSEVIIAASDLLLLLGRLTDVKNYTYNTSKVVGFFVPMHTAVELYATTLHFTPIHVAPNGFLAIIILPAMTNAPLDAQGEQRGDKLLFAKNKWLMAHAESAHAKRGAHVGLLGDNIEIKTTAYR